MEDKLVDIKFKDKTKEEQSYVWNKPFFGREDSSLFMFTVIAGFLILVALTISLFTRGQLIADAIVDLSKSGYVSLKEARNSTNLEEARESFKEAQSVFAELASKARVFEGSISAPADLAVAGKALSDAGELMTDIVINTSDLPKKIVESNLGTEITSNAKASLTDEIETVLPAINKINKNLEEALVSLQKINPKLVPEDFRAEFIDAINDLEFISTKFSDLSQNIPGVLDLLGAEKTHTYLILVQNNAELRPTGGFIGNLIVAEMSEGYLTKFEQSDIYNFDGQLVEAEDVPPEFEGFVDKLGIRDANYNPEFAASAELVEKLFQRANGPSADTIIAVDQTVLEDLLRASGPVILDEYPAGQINADNFKIVLTYLIEANKEQNEQDKAILKGFVEKLKQQLLAGGNVTDLIRITTKNAKTKHIQAYSKNDDIQSIFERLQISGSIPKDLEPNEDYLLVTNTSIGGNKTDDYIDQRIIHESQINREGKVWNTVTVTKTHTFSDAEELRWLEMLSPFGIETLHDPTRYVLGRGTNVSQVKVYVPFGSELKAAKGIDISKVQTFNDAETLKTYFLFPQEVMPGHTSSIAVSYSTPLKIDTKPAGAYKLFLQKQSGQDNVTFQKKYLFGEKIKSYKYYPSNYSISTNGKYTHILTLDTDKKMAAIVGE